ncbi:MAG: 2,3-dehydroadipyl-CoA hydratase [Acidobacteria bacterium]|nr:MAG: 2,3-dehydroadipyl-CoA hydratase [Acidobacteriota bacterium]
MTFELDDGVYVQDEQPVPHVTLIRFTRSAKRNALSNPMVLKLARLLADAQNDVDIRAAVITGDELAFSAGADLKNMRKGGVTAVGNDPKRVDAWRVIDKFSKPLIAAVNGYALGAGNELAMCCDFVVAGRNAQFGQPEVKTGGVPGDGGTQRLPCKVGSNLAAYMIMTGNPIDAETAYRVGYAVEICDPKDTVNRAIEIAAIIASRAPFAVRSAKACMAIAHTAPLDQGLAFERVSILRNHATADRAEGLAAFIEKREPHFTGE